MPPAAPSPEDDLNQLVADCVARILDEGEGVVDAICGEHPEHASELRRLLPTMTATLTFAIQAYLGYGLILRLDRCPSGDGKKAHR